VFSASGVNIAARLEALAPPGGIVIARAARCT
jgi:class 3 adenylate cyclase